MLNHSQLRDLCEKVYSESDGEVGNIEYLINDSVVTFRGTDELKDWITNVRILPWWHKGIGWCPAGFVKTAEDLCVEILCRMVEKDIPANELVLTGHSLGGAMALLVGAVMQNRHLSPAEIVTFGAPKCGRLKLLDDLNVTCYRNGKDIVPTVPHIMRRHKKNVRIGIPGSRIKDHFISNYKIPEE